MTMTRSTAGSTSARPRATWQRAAVNDILQRTEEFRSAQQIHAALESEGTKVGLATVYRNLTAMAESGEVDQVRNAEGETLYRCCHEPEHHHHIVCRSCGHTVEVSGGELEAWIASVSAARPKIANYPFTTLHPNLGVVRIDENHSFVMADIPGLIEGAAEGAGLGHRFLKHLSRTGLLLHVVDLAPFDEAVNPAEEALAIINELRKYDEELYDKPRWLVLNKLDMLNEEEAQARTAAFLEAIGWDYPKPDDRFQFDMETPRLFQISALTHQGTQELVHQINQYLTEKKRIEAEKAEAEQAAVNTEIAEQQPKTDTGVFKPE